MVYLEGTGVVGGIHLIRAAITHKQPFIVSSGDPVSGFFHVTQGPLHGRIFGAYEKMLYCTCVGFVGWTPYLTGRALQMGAPRAVTVEGAANLDDFYPFAPAARDAARQKYGLPLDHLVCGVVGSLNWSPRQAYCYGLELVETLKRLKRTDVSLLIVGDGDGKARLEACLPAALQPRVRFTGRVPKSEVVQTINAMDIGFITQTIDVLGQYRLTTKLPEYLACGLPVAMSPIPGFYDYVMQAGWPLPAFHPASVEFHTRCAQWLDALGKSDVEAKASHARNIAETHFDYKHLSQRFCAFVNDLIGG